MFRATKQYGPKSFTGIRHSEVLQLEKELVGLLAADEEVSVLDVGCGDGQLSRRIVSNNVKLHACDWKIPADIDCAEFQELNLNVSGLSGYKDNSIELIFCSDVLEHVERPAELLRETQRVLKPKGFALFSIPNSWNVFERMRFLCNAGFKRYRSERVSGPWGHISFFTKEILESIADRAGLQLITIVGGPQKGGHIGLFGYILRCNSSLFLTYNAYIVFKKP